MEEKKKIVKKIVDFMETCMSLEERLDLDRIAEHAGYSKFYLNRIFSEVTGCTLHRYIKERRLTEAARKLVLGEDSIADIGLEASYQSQQAFTLAFKQAYGCTPQTYRKMGEFKELRTRQPVLRQTEIGRCAA